MTTTHAVPVTVAIARRVDPSRASEMVAWMRAGTALAEAFPGFLGAGWVQSAPGSPEWHMLYRFADHEALRSWEESPQRHWWLTSAQGIVEHTRTERRTGIEGWFDPPLEQSVEPTVQQSAEPVVLPNPPRWKQAVTRTRRRRLGGPPGCVPGGYFRPGTIASTTWVARPSCLA